MVIRHCLFAAKLHPVTEETSLGLFHKTFFLQVTNTRILARILSLDLGHKLALGIQWMGTVVADSYDGRLSMCELIHCCEVKQFTQHPWALTKMFYNASIIPGGNKLKFCRRGKIVRKIIQRKKITESWEQILIHSCRGLHGGREAGESDTHIKVVGLKPALGKCKQFWNQPWSN